MKKVWIIQEESDYEDERGSIIGVYATRQKAINFIESKGLWFDHEKQRRPRPEQWVSVQDYQVE